MKCNFEVDNFTLVSENSNSQFATVEFDIARSGQNTHRMEISREAIKASKGSVEGKPILASFNYTGTNFRGHEADEIPVGFFDDNAKLVEKDNELYIRATGRIWKRYFANVMDIFKRKDGRTDVSMEAEILKGKSATKTEDGAIDLFSLLGVTLLGVKPAIQGAEARVLSFSEMKDEYEKESQTELEQFSNVRKQTMAQTYKVNKTELKDTPWGNIDKVAMRNKIMEATNRASLVRQVYALVENGWENAPSEHLKYPLMQLVGDTFYYNRGALASALAYAKQENEQSVIDKVERLYRKFKLNMEDEMAEIKKEEMSAEVVENQEVVEQQEENKVVEENTEVNKETQVEEFEEQEPEGHEENDNKEEDEKVEEFEAMSFAQALIQLMDCASADERVACRETMSYNEDENIVMERVCAACDEIIELRDFKAQCLAEKTECGVAEVLASVKSKLSQEDFATLEEQSKEVKFETLDTFAMQAKAFAFEHMSVEAKEAQEDEVIRMGIDNINNETPKNVFARILGK